MYSDLSDEVYGKMQEEVKAISFTREQAVAEMPGVITNTKAKVNEAFKLMRRAGLIARQNYKCCQSCAGYAITNDVAEKTKKGKEVKGVCYYHRQDAQNRDEGASFYLAYGQVEDHEMGSIGLETEEVGKMICKILDDCDVKYEWSGSGNSRIEIQPLDDYMYYEDYRQMREKELKMEVFEKYREKYLK